ncbi:MAG: hypothetical protein ACI32N_00770 [Bulleidia sp.]
MSPIAYITGYDVLFRTEDIRCFELFDRAENIFNRLVFPDVQVPEGYTEKHKQYYLREIQADLNYFHSVYRNHMEMVHMNEMSVSEVVEKAISMIDG